jgi:hypothetical protein
MGQESALVWFFVLLIVILVVVLAILIVGFIRTRSPVDGASHGAPEINEYDQPVAERLGESQPKQFGTDPRGDDVGGNFSSVPPETDNNSNAR